MPGGMRMAGIERILKLAGENVGLSKRRLARAIGCSRNTGKRMKNLARTLNVAYGSIQIFFKVVQRIKTI